MKKFIEEFKAFALRGNVMDMAIGVIIGGAFTSIVTSLTENLINPILGLFGGTDLSGFVLNSAVWNCATVHSSPRSSTF